MDLVAKWRAFRDRRHYADQVEGYLPRFEFLRDRVNYLRQVDRGLPASVSLAAGERYVGAVGSGLTRGVTSTVRTTAGGSHPVGGSRAYASRSTSRSVEAVRVIDYGVAHVTTKRILFLGDKRTVEWPMRRILGIDSLSGGGVVIHLAGRQRSMGLRCSDWARDRWLRVLLEIGEAYYEARAQGLYDHYAAELVAAVKAAPPAPPGVATDPRLPVFVPRTTASAATSASVAEDAGEPDAGARIQSTGSEELDRHPLTTVPEPVAEVRPATEDPAEAEASDIDDDEDPGGVVSSAPVTVAGERIDDAAQRILDYLVDHAGTVKNYDLRAGTFDSVTEEVVRVTRNPWMASHISRDQGVWFVERAASAPWELVADDAVLADADPAIEGGLYDRASQLWSHFMSDAPRGVSRGKVSKVLHLMRPGVYPILDSRVLDRYDGFATAAAQELRQVRPSLAPAPRNYWAAIRADVLANRGALAQVRESIRCSDVPGAADVIEHLSDIRLIDILVWADER